MYVFDCLVLLYSFVLNDLIILFFHCSVPGVVIEDTTQKAGNFKQFGIFVKMICRALQENDTKHILVDILTFADLEILRARKRGELLPINAAVQAGNNSSGGSVAGTVHTTSAGNNKRYIILTYINDFDKVHYPLSLMFEGNKPNTESMKRTIRELRVRLSENELRAAAAQRDSHSHSHGNHSDSAQLQANRQLISKLRQDNVHLQHQIKQLQHSSKTTGSPQTHSKAYSKSASALQHQMNQQIQHHVAENDALMKKHLDLKKDKAALTVQLDELSRAFEKQRKEVVIWKVKYDKVIKAPGDGSAGYSRADAGSRSKDERIHQLEQQLAQERADFRRKLAGAAPQNPWRGRDTKPRVDSGVGGRRTIVNKYDNVKSSNYGSSRARSYTPPARRGTSSAGSSPHKPFDPTAYTRDKEAKRQHVLAERSKRAQAAQSRRQFYDDGYSSTGSARSDRSGRSTLSSRSAGSRNSDRPGYASDTSSTSRRSVRSTGSTRSTGSARSTGSGPARGAVSSTTRQREPTHSSSGTASGQTNRKSRLAGAEKQGNNRMYSGDVSKARSHSSTNSRSSVPDHAPSFARSGSQSGIASANILGTESIPSPARQRARNDQMSSGGEMMLTGHNLSNHNARSEIDTSPNTRVLNQLADQNDSQLSSIEQISVKIAQMSTYHNGGVGGGVGGSGTAVADSDAFEYSEDFSEPDAVAAPLRNSGSMSAIATAAHDGTPRSSIDTSSFSTTSSPARKPVSNNYTASSPARRSVNNFMPPSSPARTGGSSHVSSPVRQSTSSTSAPDNGEELGNDLDAIDKRIQVLSAYLDKAR